MSKFESDEAESLDVMDYVTHQLSSPTINPFVSEAQRRACYAGAMPGVDCGEWESKTPKDLPKRLSPRAKRKLARNARKATPGPNRVDPTQTTAMRRDFLKKVKGSFAILRGRIRRFVGEQDSFGLGPEYTANKYQFITSPEKVEKFQDWLRDQLGSTVTSKKSEDLWSAYAKAGYAKGAGRAFDDVNRSRRFHPGGGEFYAGSRAEFLRSSFGRPETVEKIKLLAGRSFDDLENVTADMSTRMSRVLTDGLTEGMNPRDVAREMDEVVDLAEGRAELIARTEIIRAHAEGQLDSLDAMGVETVGAMVEWSTAGDDRVCPECEEMEGEEYTIEDARGMIPLHPNCRCAWVPTGFSSLLEGE